MDTALSVLTWAVDHRGAAPSGTLTRPGELIEPVPVVRRAAARLAAVTCAKLRLTGPPLDDATDVGTETALVAAAIGARSDPEAARLLRAAGPIGGTYDLLARHAMAGPVLAAESGEEAFRDALREASPLSALLDHPGAGAEPAAEQALDMLLEHRDGRRLFVEFFGRVPESPEQSRWRGVVLQRLRAVRRDRPLVVDVYEAALSRYRPELDAFVRTATQSLGTGVLVSRPQVEPVAKWWQALAFLERSHPALLRSRRRLVGYEAGVRLYRNAWRLGVVR